MNDLKCTKCGGKEVYGVNTGNLEQGLVKCDCNNGWVYTIERECPYCGGIKSTYHKCCTDLNDKNPDFVTDTCIRCTNGRISRPVTDADVVECGCVGHDPSEELPDDPTDMRIFTCPRCNGLGWVLIESLKDWVIR